MLSGLPGTTRFTAFVTNLLNSEMYQGTVKYKNYFDNLLNSFNHIYLKFHLF